MYANGTIGGYAVNYPDACILYDRSIFSVVDSGWYWLSPTPDRPSWGWTISLPRLVVWAHFFDARTGETVVFISTHFDNNGANKNPSATLFMERSAPWVSQGVPVIATGDFNSNFNSSSYAILRDGLGDGFAYLNTWNLAAAPRFVPNDDLGADFGCAGGDSPYPTCLIDHILVSNGPAGVTWRVSDWLVDVTAVRDTIPYHPSDHRANVATVAY